MWRLPLAGLLAAAGVAHIVRPGPFEGIVPPWLGAPGPWVLVSGAAELGCAAALLAPGPDARRRGALAAAGLLVVVFPANVSMAWSAFAEPSSPGYRALTLARLPLQVPPVLAALSVARAAREASAPVGEEEVAVLGEDLRQL